MLDAATYRPVSTPKLHEIVVQQIAIQILNGTLITGTSLPSEPTLGQQFAVSRTVIREAVRVLVSKGLVAVKHGSGIQVQPPDTWNHLDPLILFEQLRLGQAEDFFNELLELRRIVEGEVAALAALRRTPEDLHALQRYRDQMRAVIDDPKAFTQLDIAFHNAILVAARNRFLAQSLRPASQALYVGRLISSQRSGGPAVSQQGHEEILAAIEQEDQALARTAMLRHILQFEDDIRTTRAEGFAKSITDLSQDLGAQAFPVLPLDIPHEP